LRLTTNADRQHGGREVERGAALRPSVAAAMVALSEPADDDVFLDPMCGTGTLLLERAVAGRYELLLGGDSDPAAVEATLANFGPRHQPWRIELWDARKLPLEDGSVTRLVTNLPWGRQIGEKAAMPVLYAALVPEFARVLAPGGRMVLLTSEWDALKAVLRDSPTLSLERTVSNAEILGRRADMFVLVRI
jgi:tRNA (guanine6-N2)-methyltransferase